MRKDSSTKHILPGLVMPYDSGADSCAVRKIAKIESVTMRTANLVGYDPQTTKSSSLPIVTFL